MHELWLCKSILGTVVQYATEHKAILVKQIVLEVGELSAVDADSLLFNLNMVLKGTLAEEASVRILDIPGEALCESCQKKVPLRQYYDPCSLCGSHYLQVLQGEELRVQSMVVE